ncbi:hypothetical protein COT63_02135 [Candidatus Shapirobacteria bacterium CG09_land_8_20_14_0_10_38_17]|uniref:HTH arsR-type domain-containing protein n=1 Tax=Candidatus Shapirobacteria bacterium CG09_land_8_20_14_0_10_38_17 TaxID=1974884 RepID=A0A2H0WQX5_9BACT|nr:MAG: hypothetical protein COT63_02135 [Candidatus Shapirobacteria bacterium CG09_land_8_20_14_0_10_38_17]
MLRHLFISKVRVKLLEEFFSHPQGMFYGRQLVRKIDEQINAVRRELQNLQKGRVLHSEKRGNRIYYFLNPHYSFYEPLMAMIVKRVGLGKQIIKYRSRLGKIRVVFFSQRFVERLPKKDSEEIDIFIVGRVILPELAVLVRKEEEERGEEINYTVMDEKEFRFRLNGRDPFLTGVLIQPKFMVLGSERQLVE